MSDGTAALRRTIDSAGDLQSVVRTMKALAASAIGPYEQAVRALGDYAASVERGLGACLREAADAPAQPAGREDAADTGPVVAIVFGSDQGLVCRFNEVIAEHAIKTLAGAGAQAPGDVRFWAVGERVDARLADAGWTRLGGFKVPGSVAGIAPLVGQLQAESEAHRAARGEWRVHVFHNRPDAGALYTPVDQRLLPLDAAWRRRLAGVPWPGRTRPEVLAGVAATLAACVREHLFISLFRACAESLASENASRLAAMQRADKNIDEMRGRLQRTLHRVRQNSIDDELFDVTAGFAALS